MGETIDYEGDFANVPEALIDEVCETITEFGDDCKIDVGEVTNGYCWIRFRLPNGWRGGGATCEDIIKADFQQLINDNPDIELTVYCYYVENPPYEVVKVRPQEKL